MPATGTGAKTRKYRDETINLRASQRQKSLIDRAADALGRNRSTSCSNRVPEAEASCSTAAISPCRTRNSSASPRCWTSLRRTMHASGGS